MTPADAAATDAVALQTTWIISYLLSLFGDVMGNVASGSSFADAMRGHPQEDLSI